MSSYVLDQAFASERQRLDSMAQHWDPPTLGLVTSLGLGPGGRCLEVGAGAGSTTRLLAELVGPTGSVVAVDRDTRFLTDMPANVEVLRLDLVTDPLPRGQFDLVHARLVVEHLPPQRETLGALVQALRPGGWLLVEDSDWVTAGLVVPPADIHDRVLGAVLAGMRLLGYDPAYGRRLFDDVLSLGLEDTGAEFHGGQLRSDGGSSWAPWQLLLEQFQDRLVELGFLEQEDLDSWWALSRDGHSVCTSPVMFAAWGRRPAPDLPTT